MLRITSALAMAVLVTGCNGRDADGGTQASRDFPLAGFNEIAASGIADVEVHTGAPFHVQAVGTEDALDNLRLKVSDGQLAIGNKSGSMLGWLFGRRQGRVHVRVTMPEISAANLSGAGNIVIDRVAGDRFEGAIAGSGHIRINAIQAGTARFAIAGAGDYEAVGSVQRLSVAMSGAGNLRAPELTAGDVDLSISGVGNLRMRATGKVTGHVSGVGNVEIAGTQDCSIKRSGVGTIKCGA
ncbi:head GIN domain-containing protein [Sphingomonas quercus]|uniref:DUF2807 domain-containing protein n=1 Tax=Sphingomonas quercus TaxID=2842451 RepID=A0ABS6BI97_9SPHN|nr:head GIN domain-containing protein [Sphingomonas quercus]MBU3078030.1 DUF2807 domain-containing protein [Sphingomonas quercus]